jgi:alginate O-acetyltransferase complex protein AlgI
MVFNSWIFVAFFLVVYGLYVGCWGLARLADRGGWTRVRRLIGERGYRAQNSILLPASMLFYGWWDWRFLILMFVSITTDFWVARWMHQDRMGFMRKPLLLVSLVVNLGILGFFKYFDFFAGSVRTGLATLGWQVSDFTLDILLPVGISF